MTLSSTLARFGQLPCLGVWVRDTANHVDHGVDDVVGMTHPCSRQFRERVERVHPTGQPIRHAAARDEVSVSTVLKPAARSVTMKVPDLKEW